MEDMPEGDDQTDENHNEGGEEGHAEWEGGSLPSLKELAREATKQPMAADPGGEERAEVDIVAAGPGGGGRVEMDIAAAGPGGGDRVEVDIGAAGPGGEERAEVDIDRLTKDLDQFHISDNPFVHRLDSQGHHHPLYRNNPFYSARFVENNLNNGAIELGSNGNVVLDSYPHVENSDAYLDYSARLMEADSDYCVENEPCPSDIGQDNVSHLNENGAHPMDYGAHQVLENQAHYIQNGVQFADTEANLIFPENLRGSILPQNGHVVQTAGDTPELNPSESSQKQEVLHVAQAEMQLAACSAFLQILQKQLVPIQNYTQTFLQSIISSLDSRDPEVATAWLETLLDVIDLLPKDVIKKDILPMAVQKGQLSQSVQSRLACCRILGKISTKFDPFVIKKDILQVVVSLCQDVDYEVRGCMCRQLDAVARGLGLDQTKSAILVELIELAQDEESFVRLAGLETVVSILSLLDDDTCSKTVIPLLRKFCEQAIANDDSTLPLVAKKLGELCHGLQSNLTGEDKKFFLDLYRKLSRLGAAEARKEKEEEHLSPPKPIPVFLGAELSEEENQSTECRRNAGFNFPAMVLFTGPKHFKQELYSTFNSLCTDPNHLVRKTVAYGFHEVSKLLGAGYIHLILVDLITLLQDDSVEVLQGIVSHLPETLGLLAKAANNPNSDLKNVFVEVIPAMLSCEAVIASSNNWRLQECYMDQLACLPNCFSSDQIYQKFLPLLFRKLITARALPVKHAAIQTLLFLLRNTKKLEQREDMCQRLITDFCHGRSYYQRALFIDISKFVLELFSRSFFKEYFFESLLGLCTDKVPNVRLRICPFLPKLKALIKLPSDRVQLQLIETYVRKMLVNEEDVDVKTRLDEAVAELDQVQVQMESLTKKPHTPEDLIDQRKEDEEKMLIAEEEKERRDEEARSAKGERKKPEGSSAKNKDSKIPAPKRGSKVPPATSITSKERVTPAASKTSARGSANSIGSPTSRHDGPGSASSNSSRKNSAGSVSSIGSSSSMGSKGRRSSLGTATPAQRAAEIRLQRRLSLSGPNLAIPPAITNNTVKNSSLPPRPVTHRTEVARTRSRSSSTNREGPRIRSRTPAPYKVELTIRPASPQRKLATVVVSSKKIETNNNLLPQGINGNTTARTPCLDDNSLSQTSRKLDSLVPYRKIENNEMPPTRKIMTIPVKHVVETNALVTRPPSPRIGPRVPKYNPSNKISNVVAKFNAASTNQVPDQPVQLDRTSFSRGSRNGSIYPSGLRKGSGARRSATGSDGSATSLKKK